jgi:hypothetical protein
MQWTLQSHETNDVATDGEVVWSGYPDAGIKLAMMLRITPTTVAKEPGRRGEHEVSRNTIRAGKAGLFRRTCGDELVCFLPLHTRLRVRKTPGLPCALRFRKRLRDADLGRKRAARTRTVI